MDWSGHCGITGWVFFCFVKDRWLTFECRMLPHPNLVTPQSRNPRKILQNSFRNFYGHSRVLITVSTPFYIRWLDSHLGEACPALITKSSHICVCCQERPPLREGVQRGGQTQPGLSSSKQSGEAEKFLHLPLILVFYLLYLLFINCPVCIFVYLYNFKCIFV